MKMLAMRVCRPAFFRVRSVIDVLLYFIALIACILALIFNFEFIENMLAMSLYFVDVVASWRGCQ